ncbi:MAG: hypothetical protein M4D80_05025 [Myxococcota bacterium]|nr:hypothetical protein [Deltaproteobacteria bacterium]MDQ3334501.1 hypothetical protein [Myxococcota bacterium]
MKFSSSTTVRYAGTFRFPNRPILEAALTRARTRIDEEQELAALEGGWMRCFVMSDATLTVNIALPALPQHRLAAGEIFDLLARHALDGSVTATIDDVPVEQYAVERWS